MSLTDTKIRNLKAGAKQYKVSDAEGLYLLVRTTGARLWQQKYRFGGKERVLSFGIYPAVGLNQARQLRADAKATLARGEDPGAVKKQRKEEDQARRELTFASQAEAYIEKARREGRAAATISKTEWLLGMACEEFGSLAISDIDAPTILRRLRKVEGRGNFETAKRLRSKIGAVFRFAIANGVASVDPTQALRDALIRPKATPRAAITGPVAFGGLLRAVDGYQGQVTTRIALQLLSLLGQRPGEVRMMRWEDIDLEKAVWSIPAEQMKMRRPHLVPLPPQAVALLNDVRQLTGQAPYVFPSLRSLLRPMSENTLNGALRRLGYSSEDVSAHGFRATFSTFANESGLWHPDAIERQLAHVDKNAVRRAYARGEHWDERVRMMDWWAGYLDELRAQF